VSVVAPGLSHGLITVKLQLSDITMLQLCHDYASTDSQLCHG